MAFRDVLYMVRPRFGRAGFGVGSPASHWVRVARTIMEIRASRSLSLPQLADRGNLWSLQVFRNADLAFRAITVSRLFANCRGFTSSRRSALLVVVAFSRLVRRPLPLFLRKIPPLA